MKIRFADILLRIAPGGSLMPEAADRLILMEIGAAIKARRLERRLTQPQLAVAVGCSIGFLARLEGGKGGRLDLTVRVLRHLKMEVRLSLRSAEVQPTAGGSQPPSVAPASDRL